MLSIETRGKPLRIAIVGTRGIPANYGGFESFAEQLSIRLAERGHQVTVYGRSHFIHSDLRLYRGVHIRVLPCIQHKYLETVSHTALTMFFSSWRRYDLILVCNAANAFLCGIPWLAGQKVVLNVDGVERLRRKWNRLGKAFHRLGEFLATQLPDMVVTDARVIQQYYWEEYSFNSRFIPYGAHVGREKSHEAVKKLGLSNKKYLLYVSRLEPENNAHLVIQAYLGSGIRHPLLVVGDAPYGGRYIRELRKLSSRGNILLPGSIYGQAYRELLSHSLCYVHATEVGGTHPALIEAMGAGCIVLVNDTPENREVTGQAGLLYPFNHLESLSLLMQRVCRRPRDYQPLGQRAQQHVATRYNWDNIVNEYEELFYELTPV